MASRTTASAVAFAYLSTYTVGKVNHYLSWNQLYTVSVVVHWAAELTLVTVLRRGGGGGNDPWPNMIALCALVFNNVSSPVY